MFTDECTKYCNREFGNLRWTVILILYTRYVIVMHTFLLLYL